MSGEDSDEEYDNAEEEELDAVEDEGDEDEDEDEDGEEGDEDGEEGEEEEANADEEEEVEVRPKKVGFTGVDHLSPDENYPTKVRVPDEQRITSNRIQHTELVGLLCARIKQLEGGAPCLAEKTEGVSDVRELAMMELLQRRFPFMVYRDIFPDPVKNVVFYERWDVNEMVIPLHVLSHTAAGSHMPR